MCKSSLNYCLTQGKYTKIDHREELHHSSGGYYTRVVNKGALDQVVEQVKYQQNNEEAKIMEHAKAGVVKETLDQSGWIVD